MKGLTTVTTEHASLVMRSPDVSGNADDVAAGLHPDKCERRGAGRCQRFRAYGGLQKRALIALGRGALGRGRRVGLRAMS